MNHQSPDPFYRSTKKKRKARATDNALTKYRWAMFPAKTPCKTWQSLTNIWGGDRGSTINLFPVWV